MSGESVVEIPKSFFFLMWSRVFKCKESGRPEHFERNLLDAQQKLQNNQRRFCIENIFSSQIFAPILLA